MGKCCLELELVICEEILGFGKAEIGNEIQTGIVEDVKYLILVCYTLTFYYKQCGQ